jgi:two-component system sensor histidine kinase YesM
VRREYKPLFSLRERLARTIVLCWILPLLLTAMINSLILGQSINEQTSQIAAGAARSAASLCVQRINAAVEASRRASYVGAIQKGYLDYRRGADLLDLYYNIDTFMAQHYKFDDKFCFATLFFYNYGDALSASLGSVEFYALNESLFSETGQMTTRMAYEFYRDEDNPVILNNAKGLGTGVGFLNRNERIYMFRNLFLRGRDPTAVLVMMLNTANWFDTLVNVPWSGSITMAINDQVIPVRNEQLDIFGLLDQEIGVNGSLPGGRLGAFYVSGEDKQADFNFSYVVQVDSSKLINSLNRYQYASYAVAPLVIPFLIFVLVFFRKNVSDAIRILIEGSDEIKKGKFGAQVVNSAKSTEFSRLMESFNEMSSRLSTQMERIYMEEINLRDARFMALQSQINPHFLGNTLEIINWCARLGDTEKVSDMIQALSTMLGASTNRDGSRVVRLSEELEYTDAYMCIIGERYGKWLTINKEIDEECYNYYVPRLILQPMVENAVEHGISKQNNAVLIIRVYKDDDRLILEVENSGVLSDEAKARIERILSETREELNRQDIPRLGIRNTYARLKMMYGDRSDLKIFNRDSCSTLCQLIMPIAACGHGPHLRSQTV